MWAEPERLVENVVIHLCHITTEEGREELVEEREEEEREEKVEEEEEEEEEEEKVREEGSVREAGGSHTHL